MRNRATLLALAFALLGAAPAHAAFEDLGAGARAPGMSGAFTAVADDVYSIYYNPAGLAVLERPSIGASYSMLNLGLSDNSKLGSSFLGYAHPLSEGLRGTLAAAWNAYSLNNTLYRDETFYLSYGRLIPWSISGGELYGGLSLKYLRSSFGNFDAAANAVPAGGLIGAGQSDPLLGKQSLGVFDADGGLLYRFGRHYSIGAQAMHIPRPNVAFSGTDRLPLSMKLGVNYRSLISNLSAQYETEKALGGRRDSIFSIGAERWFPKMFVGDFGLRGGFGLGSRDYKNLSLGLSYRNRRVSVDYAFALPINSVDATAGSHKMALGFRFGRTTDEEESLEMILEAMKQLKSGQPVSVKRVRRKLPSEQLRVFEEYLAQARSLESKARYKDAIAKFGLALTQAPGEKDIILRFGRLNLVGQEFESLPLYQKDPAQATLHLGLLAYLAEDYREAVQKVSEALAINPEDKRVSAFLEQLERTTGLKRLPLAVKKPRDYDIAVKLTRASAALEARDYKLAVELSLDVVRGEPANASAWENLGTAYFALEDYESSKRAWRKAYEFEKSPAIRDAIRGYLRSISRAVKKSPRAAPVARPLPERPSLSRKDIEELFNKVVDHYTRKELQKAKEILESILDSDPKNIRALKALRRVQEEMTP